MSKFQVGDRVRVYDADQLERTSLVWTAVVLGIDGDTVEVGNTLDRRFVHRRQLRKLVKRERRKIWMDPKIYDAAKEQGATRLGLISDFVYFEIKPPTEARDWIEFVEVRRRK